MNQLLTSETIAALKDQIKGQRDRLNAIARCPTDLPFFCEWALKIRPKMGALIAYDTESRTAQATSDY